ncbi:MAG: hypothetical protein WC568_04275 [Candidatus Methanoperedens sp.]
MNKCLVTYKLRGWGRESNIKLPHIVSNVIAEYNPLECGVKEISFFPYLKKHYRKVHILINILFMTLKCQEANKLMSNKAKKKPTEKTKPAPKKK